MGNDERNDVVQALCRACAEVFAGQQRDCRLGTTEWAIDA